MKTIVFCNARDEDNILEWIAHYINLGFTTVFIYDHKSKTPIQTLLCVSTNDKTHPRNKVILERINTDIPMMKTTLMMRAVDYAKKREYDWMLYIDADEFLYLKDHTNIEGFLNTYKHVQQLAVNTLMFGSNGHLVQPTDGIVKSFTKCEVYPNPCVKCFVRPKYAQQAMNPHYFRLKTHRISTHCENKPLDLRTPWLYKSELTYDTVPAYFAHYYFQSYEEYKKRKIRIPRDDNGKFRDLYTEEEVHAKYNDVINEDLYIKYDAQNQIMVQFLKPNEIQQVSLPS